MSIIESTATALVRFTGLGIIVFNKQKGRGEIAIIRDEAHRLSIRIQQPRFRDGVDKDIVVYEDIAAYTDLPKDGVEINIAAKGEAAVNGYDIYRAHGEFNRLESDDMNDYRWIVSMKALHDEKITMSTSTDQYPVSKLYIENGLFYARKLDTNMFFEKVEKDASGSEVAREHFGNVAETIGVKIEADEVVFNIKTDDINESHTLARVSGLPFRIEIMNMNYDEGAAVSDMPDYYKYLGSESGTRYDLEPVADEPGSSGGAISSKDFCHPIDGGDGDPGDDGDLHPAGGFTSIDELG